MVVSKSGKYSLISLLVLSITVLSACSTKKSTIITRTYHNVTAHFNGYFNAKEKIKAGAKKLDASTQDNYDRLLKVFKYGDKAAAKSVFPEMDLAIKKASVVIDRHSIYVDNKEHCAWIDDSFFLIGQAQFFKQDYWTAIETLKYVSAEYEDDPIRYKALVWLIKSYIELGKMPDAEYLIDFLRSRKDLERDVAEEFAATTAHYHIQLLEYDNAAEELVKALGLAKKKKNKIRYTYIIAQLYQELDDYGNAFDYYNKVLKLNPPYEIAFNAKINRARSFDVNNPEGEAVKKELYKMLKDDKNKDYLGQIYYALAGIAQNEGKESEAVDFYKLSIKNSGTNTNQKAISYLELAEIYFEKPKYKLAQAYYDSSVTLLSKEYPGYYGIVEKKNSLTNLVVNLAIIETQDSLQRLAVMTPEEREKAVQAIIDAENAAAEKLRLAEEERKRKEQQQQQQNAIFANQRPGNQQSTPTTGGGSWYFYNPSATSFGMSEFKRKWGDRNNEDNWRRSKKTSGGPIVSGGGDDPLDDLSAQADSLRALDSEKRKLAYMSAIPEGSEAIESSNLAIADAYYLVGIIYKEELDDYPRSAEAFKELLKRYPDSKHALACYYNLYRIYVKLNDEEQANYYKNIILNDYPDSDFSKIITDPDFFKENKKKTAILEVFYENTYKAYSNGQYASVIRRKEQADEMFPPNELSPKFDMLRALSIGKLETVAKFKTALQDIVVKYPQDTIALEAQSILDHINNLGSVTAINNENAAMDSTGYLFYPDSTHFFLFVFTNNAVNTNEFKVKISDYNREFYSLRPLKINNSFIDFDHQYIIVKDFENAEQAKSYMEGLFVGIPEIASLKQEDYDTFVIADDNFQKFFKEKNLMRYLSFYQRRYIN